MVRVTECLSGYYSDSFIMCALCLSCPVVACYACSLASRLVPEDASHNWNICAEQSGMRRSEITTPLTREGESTSRADRKFEDDVSFTDGSVQPRHFVVTFVETRSFDFRVAPCAKKWGPVDSLVGL